MNSFLVRFQSARVVWAVSLFVILLQRTPILRVLVQAEFANGIRAGQMLGAAVPIAAVATASTVHAQTGATTWTTNPATPVNGTVGENLTVVFAFTGGSATPESYEITGSLPPGLSVPNATGSPGALVLNSTSGGSVEGTPTSAGSYSVTLVAWDGPNKSPGSNGSSPSFNLEFNIVDAAGSAPTFSQQPMSVNADFRGEVTFMVEVDGTPEPTLQWRKDGEAIGGETSATLILTDIGTGDAGTYDVIATNSEGSATSDGAILTVNPPAAPTIDVQPVSLTVLEGGGGYFSVNASGSDLSYQWFKDGVPIDGADSSSLFIQVTGTSDPGEYTVRVSNPGGAVDSGAATLSLVANGDSRLVNLSTRAQVGTGSDILIPGFVLSGSGEKSLLVRAVGPRLEQFGVSGTISDPTMTLFEGGAPVVTNDDWQSVPNLTEMENARQAAGAFELAPSTKDSSMLVTLGTGGYTVQASGVGGVTGVALVELYDTDAGGSDARLSNISARAQVGTGGDILIPGFVIEGDVALTLLVRGVGPKLADFGVEGVLEDPVMTLSRAIEGTSVQVAFNDDWQSNPDIAAIGETETVVGAFSLNDGGKDSALLVSLPPGSYTVQVAGKDDTTGVSLVEIYLVD